MPLVVMPFLLVAPFHRQPQLEQERRTWPRTNCWLLCLPAKQPRIYLVTSVITELKAAGFKIRISCWLLLLESTLFVALSS
jgi:hypothetical protein